MRLRPSTRGNTLRRLGIERLETRAMLAGDVMVTVTDGDLFVTGDNLSNDIVIDQAGLAAGEYRISSGADATMINGNAGPQVFSGVTDDLRIALRNGGDTLVVDTISVADDAVIELGDSLAVGNRVEVVDSHVGDDLQVTLGDVTNTVLDREGNVINVSGTNIVDDATLTTGNGVSDFGDGNDVVVDNGSMVGGDLAITTGDGTGADAGNEVDVASITVVGYLTITTGDGQGGGRGNDVNVDANTSIGLDATINTGDGIGDTDGNGFGDGNEIQVDAISVGANLSITAGQGTGATNGNQVDIFDVTVGTGLDGGDLTITTGVGEDDDHDHPWWWWWHHDHGNDEPILSTGTTDAGNSIVIDGDTTVSGSATITTGDGEGGMHGNQVEIAGGFTEEDSNVIVTGDLTVTTGNGVVEDDSDNDGAFNRAGNLVDIGSGFVGVFPGFERTAEIGSDLTITTGDGEGTSINNIVAGNHIRIGRFPEVFADNSVTIDGDATITTGEGTASGNIEAIGISVNLTATQVGEHLTITTEDGTGTTLGVDPLFPFTRGIQFDVESIEVVNGDARITTGDGTADKSGIDVDLDDNSFGQDLIVTTGNGESALDEGLKIGIGGNVISGDLRVDVGDGTGGDDGIKVEINRNDLIDNIHVRTGDGVSTVEDDGLQVQLDGNTLITGNVDIVTGDGSATAGTGILVDIDGDFSGQEITGNVTVKIGDGTSADNDLFTTAAGSRVKFLSTNVGGHVDIETGDGESINFGNDVLFENADIAGGLTVVTGQGIGGVDGNHFDMSNLMVGTGIDGGDLTIAAGVGENNDHDHHWWWWHHDHGDGEPIVSTGTTGAGNSIVIDGDTTVSGSATITTGDGEGGMHGNQVEIAGGFTEEDSNVIVTGDLTVTTGNGVVEDDSDNDGAFNRAGNLVDIGSGLVDFPDVKERTAEISGDLTISIGDGEGTSINNIVAGNLVDIGGFPESFVDNSVTIGGDATITTGDGMASSDIEAIGIIVNLTATQVGEHLTITTEDGTGTTLGVDPFDPFTRGIQFDVESIEVVNGDARITTGDGTAEKSGIDIDLDDNSFGQDLIVTTGNGESALDEGLEIEIDRNDISGDLRVDVGDGTGGDDGIKVEINGNGLIGNIHVRTGDGVSTAQDDGLQVQLDGNTLITGNVDIVTGDGSATAGTGILVDIDGDGSVQEITGNVTVKIGDGTSADDDEFTTAAGSRVKFLETNVGGHVDIETGVGESINFGNDVLFDNAEIAGGLTVVTGQGIGGVDGNHFDISNLMVGTGVGGGDLTIAAGVGGLSTGTTGDGNSIDFGFGGGTTVNGNTTITIGDGQGGITGNRVRIEGTNDFAGYLSIETGAGTGTAGFGARGNLVNIRDGVTVGADLTVSTGANTLSTGEFRSNDVQIVRSMVDGSVAITTGDGNTSDNVANLVVVEEVTITSDLNVTTGDAEGGTVGNFVDLEEGSIGGDATISMGDGTATFTVGSLIDVEEMAIVGDLAITVGDSVGPTGSRVEIEDESAIGGALSIVVGDATGEFFGHNIDVEESTIGGNATITTGDGEGGITGNEIEIGTTVFFVGSDPFEPNPAVDIGGDLTITTGDGEGTDAGSTGNLLQIGRAALEPDVLVVDVGGDVTISTGVGTGGENGNKVIVETVSTIGLTISAGVGESDDHDHHWWWHHDHGDDEPIVSTGTTGAGNSVVVFETSVTGDAIINTGDGEGGVDGNYVELNELSVTDDLSITTGAGDGGEDGNHVLLETVSSSGLAISTGLDRESTSTTGNGNLIQIEGGVSANDDATLTTGDGKGGTNGNNVAIVAGTFFAKDLTIHAGDGQTNSPAVGFSGNRVFLPGLDIDGDLSVTVGDGHGGANGNELSIFDAATIGGNVTIVTGEGTATDAASDDGNDVNFDGVSIMGNVSVTTGDGEGGGSGNEVQVRAGSTVGGNVTIVTGKGTAFRADANAGNNVEVLDSTVIGELSVNTGNGDGTTVDNQVNLRDSGLGSLFVKTGSSGWSWWYAPSSDDDVLLANVDIDRHATIVSGRGADRVFMELGSSVGDELRIETGSGRDEVLLDDFSAGDSADILLGSRDDLLTVLDSVFAASVLFDGGSGDDDLNESGNSYTSTPVVVGF